jgi:hypothetical protein
MSCSQEVISIDVNDNEIDDAKEENTSQDTVTKNTTLTGNIFRLE